MTDTEVLLAAADLIERNGLHKGDYWPDSHSRRSYVPGEPCCAIGAMCAVTGMSRGGCCNAEVLLERHVGGPVVPWSDEHTQAEVVATLRAVATSEET